MVLVRTEKGIELDVDASEGAVGGTRAGVGPKVGGGFFTGEPSAVSCWDR